MDKKITLMLRRGNLTHISLLFFLSFLLSFNPIFAQEDDGIPTDEAVISAGESLFNGNCKSCHNVHKKVIGPALKDVWTRVPQPAVPWITAFVKNSTAVIASGDEYAVNLYNEYNKTQMTSFPSFSDDEILSVIAYIKAESANAPVEDAPVAENGGGQVDGTFYLEADGEVEFFQKYELDLPENVEVSRLEVLISPYSHHFIAYNFVTPSGADVIPHGLRLNSYHNDINLVAAVQEQTDLHLPEGTAFRWDKNIVLDLNSHYINYLLTRPYQCEAYINVYTQPVGTAEQEMKAALLVNPSIPIPNNGNLITHTKAEYQFGADSIYIWGLMGHTHQYGTGYKVWKRLPTGQKGELIYDGSCPQGTPGCVAPYFDYQHIPIRYWEPELLPVKWGHGIVHEATWVNDGPQPLNFGPTSDDEMMVLIVFYTEQQITVDANEPNNPAALAKLEAYPNPASHKAWVKVPGQQGVRMLRLFDMAGRERIRQQNIQTNLVELDLSGLAPGAYWIDADGLQTKLILFK